MPLRLLGIIDRAYRGALEAQFFDVIYGFLYFREQLARADLMLRGAAVTLAVAEDVYRPVLELGSVRLDTLPDYRASLRAALAEGSTVLVDEPDLARLGLGAADLVPGVRCLDTNQFATRWQDYDAVWFV